MYLLILGKRLIISIWGISPEAISTGISCLWACCTRVYVASNIVYVSGIVWNTLHLSFHCIVIKILKALSFSDEKNWSFYKYFNYFCTSRTWNYQTQFNFKAGILLYYDIKHSLVISSETCLLFWPNFIAYFPKDFSKKRRKYGTTVNKENVRYPRQAKIEIFVV